MAPGPTAAYIDTCNVEPAVSGALHVVVAAEDVGAHAASANIASEQQRNGGGTDIGGADAVLGYAHAPDQRCRLLRREHFGDALELFALAASLGSTESLVLPAQILRGRELDAEQQRIADAFLIVLPKLIASGRAPASRQPDTSSQLAASKLEPRCASRSRTGRAGLAFTA